VALVAMKLTLASPANALANNVFPFPDCLQAEYRLSGVFLLPHTLWDVLRCPRLKHFSF